MVINPMKLYQKSDPPSKDNVIQKKPKIFTIMDIISIIMVITEKVLLTLGLSTIKAFIMAIIIPMKGNHFMIKIKFLVESSIMIIFVINI